MTATAHIPPMPAPVALGQSGLRVSPVCLGTMTFGEQVDADGAFAILDRAAECGIDFMDAAEMYPVPTRADTFGHTETILGQWFAARPGMRQRWTVATKMAGPARDMHWIRPGEPTLRAQHFEQSCEGSLRRLRTDVIDLYQIHWPARHVPAFGNLYFDPKADSAEVMGVHEQLQALQRLVRAGKVRAVGLSNETPWGVHEFVRLAEQHGLPRVASVQNVYGLLNRQVDNALDETLHRLGVSLLAYSPLGFGLLTGKYDEHGIEGAQAPAQARIARYAQVRAGRWGRPDALRAARRYNALAREHGLSPTHLALAFCLRNWRVASTIIGVTSVAQLDDNLAALSVTLSPELLKAVDAIRWELRDPTY